MGVTDNNLCDSCINLGCEFQSGIVRTECAFYMPPHIEPDRMGRLIELVDQDYQYCLDYASGKTNIMALNNINRIIKAIADGTGYENRLKADMVAMLTEIQLEILELKSYESADGQDLVMLADIGILFQQKINSLKEK